MAATLASGVWDPCLHGDIGNIAALRWPAWMDGWKDKLFVCRFCHRYISAQTDYLFVSLDVVLNLCTYCDWCVSRRLITRCEGPYGRAAGSVCYWCLVVQTSLSLSLSLCLSPTLLLLFSVYKSRHMPVCFSVSVFLSHVYCRREWKRASRRCSARPLQSPYASSGAWQCIAVTLISSASSSSVCLRLFLPLL